LQADSFVATLRAEQHREEELLGAGLIRKGEAMAGLLAQTAGSLITAYEFDGLQQLAEGAANDADIVGVVFANTDGDVLAQLQSRQPQSKSLKKEILFENEVVGSVEIALSMAGVEKNIAALSARIASLTEETAGQRRAAAWSLGRRVLIAAGLAVLIMCLVIYGCLARSVIKPLEKIIGGLDESADQAAAAAGQLSAAGLSLSEGAAEQAAATEQTSASLEEISTMARQNADNAGRCDQLMQEVTTVVAKANESMSAQAGAMAAIARASEETSKIIKTIDEIAFQTNLLALNAAVEAARAGAAGAGFAVVADEVRSLAMRAAGAAKDTAVLIDGTLRKVKEGEALAARTDKDFAEVAAKTGKVGGLVSEIAGASHEQMRGLEQVNMAIAEIDQVTQRTSANAEESAGASEELNSQAGQLKDFVGNLVTLIKGGSGSRVAEDHGPQPADRAALQPTNHPRRTRPSVWID